MHLPLSHMALLGRDEAYYNTYLGPFPEKAIIVNVAAGVSYFPRANIAIDPIYSWPISQIRNAGLDALIEIRKTFKNPEDADSDPYYLMLHNSLDNFSKHAVTQTHTRYVSQSLPWITEVNGDLVLCSHFIFTYDLGLYGTMACIDNLMTIAPEARIYPYCADQIPAIAHFMPHLKFNSTPTYLCVTRQNSKQ